MRRICAALVAVVLVSAVGAQEKMLAPAPPMGWNSWDSYGLTVTEAQFRANADVVAAKLKAFGWRYVVVDEGWYLQNPESAGKPETLVYTANAQGQYSPSLNRFPSAANDAGFKPLSDAVHAQGLKFGIHIIRGIPKKTVAADTAIAGSAFRASEAADTADVCPWNPDNYGVKDNAAGQAWYDALMKQYAGWGVDYVKVDCIAAHPFKGAEIQMIHRAIVKTGRPIVLSLSPGPTALENAALVGENAQLWRISDDVWDKWEKGKEWSQSLKAQFPVIASWQKYVKAGNWPDADMLPLGHLGPVPGDGKERDTRLTHDEQRTMVTLWAIARSPLFLGANLTQMDGWLESLVTNAEVMAMNQRGREQRLVSEDGNLVAWVSKGDRGQEYLALFNLGDGEVRVEVPLAKYGLTAEKYAARDIWEKKDLGKVGKVGGVVAPHGVLLLGLRP
ncbi:MAG TPA: glycoside hydrolase family 27 protein [Edaphobacter sp.]